MLMFLSVLSLTSRRCCDSLHAEQKLPGERSVCGCGEAFLSACSINVANVLTNRKTIATEKLGEALSIKC